MSDTPSPTEPSTPDEIVRRSRGASLVFLPFSIHGERFKGAVWRCRGAAAQLPVVVLTLAAQDVDLAAEPDQEDEEADQPAAPPRSDTVAT